MVSKFERIPNRETRLATQDDLNTCRIEPMSKVPRSMKIVISIFQLAYHHFE